MTSHQLRSRNWFGRQDLDGFVHRSWLKAEGFSDHVFDGRPVIGIANSWSELTDSPAECLAACSTFTAPSIQPCPFSASNTASNPISRNTAV
jgi:dihydroxyacid dehydratase/phosphogluconate dehydratase